jgi:hypothetical protein
MALFDPEAHEALSETRWDEARVRDGIAAIVADAAGAVDEGVWPQHPLDGWPESQPAPTTIYMGSAGMVWALHTLGSSLDLGTITARALERYRERPDFEEGDVPSLLMGESGLLLVARLVGAPVADDARLLERIRENVANESWELMWGSPGTMLAARELGAEEAWHESAERLWAEWGDDGLWTQRLYGRERQFLGPVHGLAGNAHALRGFRDEALRERLVPVLERMALREDGLANWPWGVGDDLSATRTQWCHGAPGIVATLGDLLPQELALAGAELTWQAGPLVKGAGLCHGTGGNGYALLKAFALTGDELWLDRARRFAIHALEQVEQTRVEHGRGRFTLWTGDVGTALYLRSCLDGDERVPTIDYW